jgi:predicted ATPase
MSTEDKSCEGIYFLSLTLENVRCFGESQTLDLSDGNGKPAQWTVILGNNGTGKTTLLEVLAEGIRISGYNHSHFRRINTDMSKMTSGFAFNAIAGLIDKNKKFLRFYSDTTVDDKGSESKIRVHRPDFPITENKPEKFYGKAIPGAILHKVGDLHISSMPIIFPYSASRRIKKSSSFLFQNSLHNEPSNGQGELIDAEEWLREIDYIANKTSTIQANYQKRFQIVKEVLTNLLPEVEAIRITDPSEKHPIPQVEFKMPDGWLHLSQLSLGYQTMIGWMVDLAARMFNWYPNSPNPIAEPAVVLIDEIDLHLHPKWQRTIMSYLSERFINTQFIVTAHSPLIVQAAEQANIVVLKRQGDSVTIHQQEKDVQGWRIDQLLTSDLFDLGSARSPFYENKLAQRRRILSKPELTDEDQVQLKILEAEIGDLPTAETAEDIAAMDIIRRAAELLKTSA